MSPLTLAQCRHGLLINLLADGAIPLARSDRFSLWSLGAGADLGDIVVVHNFLPEEIDNNIGGYVADELMPLLARSSRPAATCYTPSAHETFERCVGSIVRSIDGNERRAWHRFYDNTLTMLRRPAAAIPANGVSDFNASSRALYARVAELAREVEGKSLLDVATCFGFLPLYLAGRGMGSVVGCELNRALVELAEDYRRTRAVPGVSFVEADILAESARLGGAGPFDVITAIHLLEHLTPEESEVAVRNLWALTGRRMIVAVPYEAVPDPRFGHRQVFNRDRLRRLGGLTDGTCQTFEHHGGWLVADRVGRTKA